MQGMILAAGLGSRLAEHTKDKNKCMVEVNGKSLIKRQIEALKEAGIEKIIIVCGYKKEELKNYILTEFSDSNIIFVENNDYNKTNNIYSLYLAREYLVKHDTILLEGDLIFDYSIIKKIISANQDNIMAVSKYKIGMDGTVVTIKDHIVNSICGKNDISYNDLKEYYKTINIYKLSKEFCKKKYVPTLEKYINEGKINNYYEDVFSELINETQVNAEIFENEKWYEIDNLQDLEIAKCIFGNNLNSYQKRYGGYWRFNNLKDFCYLENPKFPPPKMVEQIGYFSRDLINKYPSGMDIQNFNAAKMFNIDKNKILVGNGSAELIKELGNILEGNVVVQIPVFNEYVRCFKNANIIKFDTSKNNYHYEKNDIIKYMKQVDTIVIVNPDNPTGNFLSKEDMLQILEEAQKTSTKVIVDESFIDFASEDKKYTLLKNEILDKYKNLIVLKSISKSYGVPGIRLGVMATSDQIIINKIKASLGVWNINSLAEYFLQTINLYKKEYNDSCKYIAKQREFMYNEILKNKNIEVYESQSNYLMCKLLNYDSTKFSQDLLENYNIFIKDLKGKEGFQDNNYIRIAIKNQEDNLFLINAMKEVLNKPFNSIEEMEA